ncbi:hypothetical protein CBW53_02850 [Yersinia frederiksenii]|nr:hypothetical protein CBW53_02850 [Yersinia frederiksenii]CNI68303.1 Uncharacterised protein [Yersinia frederiksenii]
MEYEKETDGTIKRLSTQQEAKIMTEGQGINIEHHDHDYHPKHHDGYGYGGGMGVGWGILGFIAFIVIIAWIWGIGRRNEEHHERLSDKHHDGIRCMDKLGYELGYTRDQLNHIEQREVAILAKQDKAYDRMCYENETMLRFGTPYGEHTQRLCTAPPAHCGEHRGNRHGGVINGSQLSDTNTFAYDHSVL